MLIRHLLGWIVVIVSIIGSALMLVLYAVCNYVIGLPVDIIAGAFGKELDTCGVMYRAYNKFIDDTHDTGMWLLGKLGLTQ